VFEDGPLAAGASYETRFARDRRATARRVGAVPEAKNTIPLQVKEVVIYYFHILITIYIYMGSQLCTKVVAINVYSLLAW
jgi:hypothetical protein